MQVHLTVRDKESNERAISRFNKTVQGSRKILKVRSSRYHSRTKTKRQVRAGAIMREFYRKKRAKSRYY